MAPGPDAPSFEDRTHSDLGVLQQRVASTETAIRDISSSVGQLRAETRAQIGELSSSLGSQIGDLAKSFNSSRTTNATSIIQNAGVVVAVIVSILSPILLNIHSMIDRNDASIETLKASRFSHGDAEELNARLTHYIETVSNRSVTHAENDIEMKRLDDLLRIEHEYRTANDLKIAEVVKDLAGESERRSEAESGQRRTDERINTIVASMNELRHDFGSSFTIGDRLKGLEAEISEMRRGVAIPAEKPAD